MNPLIIPLAVEWVFLITTVTPLIFTGRFRSRPNLGLAIWFSTFLSAGVAAAIAIVIAGSSVFETWLVIHENPQGGEPWMLALVSGFGPWLFLAIAGVSIALVNQKIEPLVEQARELKPALGLVKKQQTEYRGVSVATIELPIDQAFTDGKEIYVTAQWWNRLNAGEREQLLKHEYAHIRLRHPGLKKLAGFIQALTPNLAASKALAAEVFELTELAAKGYCSSGWLPTSVR